MTAPRKRSKRRTTGARGVPGAKLGELAARAMVLQGAAKVFAKLGVRAASVEDLLEAAGISRRTFYRLYQSKEDVMIALYKLGTDELLDACRLAMRQESEPMQQLERCIDAHLRNARERGRLLFVLGGEAQRQESALHARRVFVHDELVALLSTGVTKHLRESVDPLLLRALVLALEGLARHMVTECDEGRAVTEAALSRTRKVMLRLASATLFGHGARVTALPITE